MKNFPGTLAVIGAWLCASGFVLAGVIVFLFSSLVAIFINEQSDWRTVLFLCANMFAFIRLI